MLIRFVLFLFFFLAVECQARYRITLRNDHELTVDDYKEEGPWIRAMVYGGEVVLSKESVTRIERITDDVSFQSRGSAIKTPPTKAEPKEEVNRQLSELDLQIRKAQGELLEAQKARLGSEQVRQRELQWNRLRLERFRLSRSLNVEEKKESAKSPPE